MRVQGASRCHEERVRVLLCLQVAGVKDPQDMNRKLQLMCSKVLPGLLARCKVNLRCYGHR
jgi:hypothetical protein